MMTHGKHLLNDGHRWACLSLCLVVVCGHHLERFSCYSHSSSNAWRSLGLLVQRTKRLWPMASTCRTMGIVMVTGELVCLSVWWLSVAIILSYFLVTLIVLPTPDALLVFWYNGRSDCDPWQAPVERWVLYSHVCLSVSIILDDFLVSS